ncbi:MAG: hypothetical protein R3E01_35545 [Pirellulaceae bacterium]|nr:hypothetical protein [Planctomycetales bacterium]
MPRSLADYQVQFRFALLDLSQTSEEAIRSEPILRGVLRLLKYGRSPRLRTELREILELLRTAAPIGGVEIWLRVIGVYVMAVNDSIERDELNHILKSVFPTQIETNSLADRLLNEGREEGREEGRGEGLGKGKLTGRIQTLQELLGDEITPDSQLESRELDELEALLMALRERWDQSKQ